MFRKKLHLGIAIVTLLVASFAVPAEEPAQGTRELSTPIDEVSTEALETLSGRQLAQLLTAPLSRAMTPACSVGVNAFKGTVAAFAARQDAGTGTEGAELVPLWGNDCVEELRTCQLGCSAQFFPHNMPAFNTCSAQCEDDFRQCFANMPF